MKHVFKYELGPLGRCEVRGDPKVVHVGVEGGKVKLWAEVDDESERTVLFHPVMTGQEVPPKSVHVGTAQVSGGDCENGEIVVHVYASVLVDAYEVEPGHTRMEAESGACFEVRPFAREGEPLRVLAWTMDQDGEVARPCIDPDEADALAAALTATAAEVRRMRGEPQPRRTVGVADMIDQAIAWGRGEAESDAGGEER